MRIYHFRQYLLVAEVSCPVFFNIVFPFKSSPSFLSLPGSSQESPPSMMLLGDRLHTSFISEAIQYIEPRLFKFCCKYCKTFTTYDLNQTVTHGRTCTEMHRPEPGKIFVCYECGSDFSSYNTLLRHIFIHTDDRPYKCIFCAYGSASKHNTEKHIERLHLTPQASPEIRGRISGNKKNPDDIVKNGTRKRRGRKKHKPDWETKASSKCEATSLKTRGLVVITRQMKKSNTANEKSIVSLNEHPESLKGCELDSKTTNEEKPNIPNENSSNAVNSVNEIASTDIDALDSKTAIRDTPKVSINEAVNSPSVNSNSSRKKTDTKNTVKEESSIKRRNSDSKTSRENLTEQKPRSKNTTENSRTVNKTRDKTSIKRRNYDSKTSGDNLKKLKSDSKSTTEKSTKTDKTSEKILIKKRNSNSKKHESDLKTPDKESSKIAEHIPSDFTTKTMLHEKQKEETLKQENTQIDSKEKRSMNRCSSVSKIATNEGLSKRKRKSYSLEVTSKTPNKKSSNASSEPSSNKKLENIHHGKMSKAANKKITINVGANTSNTKETKILRKSSNTVQEKQTWNTEENKSSNTEESKPVRETKAKKETSNSKEIKSERETSNNEDNQTSNTEEIKFNEPHSNKKLKVYVNTRIKKGSSEAELTSRVTASPSNINEFQTVKKISNSGKTNTVKEISSTEENKSIKETSNTEGSKSTRGTSNTEVSKSKREILNTEETKAETSNSVDTKVLEKSSKYSWAKQQTKLSESQKASMLGLNEIDESLFVP